MDEERKYASWSQEAKRQQRRKDLQRNREQLQRVNEKLAALDIDWKQLMRMIEEDRVIIQIKENKMVNVFYVVVFRKGSEYVESEWKFNAIADARIRAVLLRKTFDEVKIVRVTENREEIE